MRSCKETAALMSKSSQAELTAWEWLGLHMHLLVCRVCRGHQRNNQILSQAIHKFFHRNNLYQPLSTTARQRIAAAIRRFDDPDAETKTKDPEQKGTD
jgi:hypothetical protein